MNPALELPVLLDAYAMVAVLRGEPAAEQVRVPLGRAGVLVHPLNLAETIDRLARVDGVDADDVEADVALLGIAVAETDDMALIDAGRIRARYYHRRTCPVSLADCVAAAHALRTGLPFATSDPTLVSVVRHEGGVVHPLPDSSGTLPP